MEEEYIQKVLIVSEGTYYAWDGMSGWLGLGNISTDQDYIDYGIDVSDLSTIPSTAWQELSNPVISYYTDDPDKKEIIIETETEPFTFYDEMEDSMKALCYVTN